MRRREGLVGVSAIKADQEKRRPGAGCGNVLSMVPGSGELVGSWWGLWGQGGWVGGSRVVISQAFGRESKRAREREREGRERERESESPPGPTGIAPPRG